MECGCVIGMVPGVRCIGGVGGNGVVRKTMINQLSSLWMFDLCKFLGKQVVSGKKTRTQKTVTQISLAEVHLSKAGRGRVTLVNRPGRLLQTPCLADSESSMSNDSCF